jgi:hypothetical protein
MSFIDVFVIFDSVFSCNTGFFIMCGHARVHMLSTTDSFVIAMKLKGEELHMVTMLLICIL